MNIKNHILNFLLLIFSTMFALLCAEQLYRTYLFGPTSFSFEKMNSVHPLGVSGLIKPANESEIIYELKPNLKTLFKLSNFQTNAHGLRDKDYEFFKPTNTFRVAVVGDSFTMPAGVEIEEAFHSILEERLNKEQHGVKFDFINFGVGGYNLRQYLATIKLKAAMYNPDLIIVGFCSQNDHQVPPEQIFSQPYRVKPEDSPFSHSYIVNKLIKTFNSQRAASKKTIFSEQETQYMSDMFAAMNHYAEQSHVPIMVVNLSHRYHQPYSEELRKLVVANHLYFADVSLPFKQTDIYEYIIYPTDAHPNAKANRIFADELYRYLLPVVDEQQALQSLMASKT